MYKRFCTINELLNDRTLVNKNINEKNIPIDRNHIDTTAANDLVNPSGTRNRTYRKRIGQ